MSAIIKIANNKALPYRVVIENDVVDIWLESLFNKESHTFAIITNLSYVKVSNYHYKVTADSIGFNTVKMSITNKTRTGTQQVFSNSLLIIVKESI